MRLGSLSLIVPDYDAAIAFYCGQMGFVLLKDQDQGRKRWVEVQPPGGGPSIVLARADTPAQRAAIGQQGAGRVWLFLHTDDFARDHDRLSRANGVTFEEDPRHEPYGTVAVFRDLFGNRWDLIEPAARADA
ncbi:MAG: VOC family protein [Pseudomonadota bacterium]